MPLLNVPPQSYPFRYHSDIDIDFFYQDGVLDRAWSWAAMVQGHQHDTF
jgi:hypothetical protein